MRSGFSNAYHVNAAPTELTSIGLVGAGRVGRALAAALSDAGIRVTGPLLRGERAANETVFLLCVPDREIPAANALIPRDAIVGHVSASAALDLLAPHERFLFHPLLSITGRETQFAGATCAIDGNTERARGVAARIASVLCMNARVIPAEKRALYHASASVASNYVTTVLGAAETLAADAGIDRAALRPLVQSAVDRWLKMGASEALTGPIARGDDETVATQRSAVARRSPELLSLWDALATATRRLAERRENER
jgi:predicted short-subunit dehydrogenase-like oxidoreductase (DUF2520 family)